MALPTMLDVVRAAQDELHDLSQALGLRLVDTVHRDLCARFPTLCRQTLAVALQPGVSEYVLPDGVVQVEGATFSLVGVVIPLRDETVESLRALDRDWRAAPPDAWLTTPDGVAMYQSTRLVGGALSRCVGFSPPPDAASAGGTVAVYLSAGPTAAVAVDTPILPGLPSKQVYVDALLYRAARCIRPASASGYLELYTEGVKTLAVLLDTQQEGVKDNEVKNSRA